MLNSGLRGHHGHGPFHQGLHGGILGHHEHGDNRKNLPHLMSQLSTCPQGRKQAQGDMLL